MVIGVGMERNKTDSGDREDIPIKIPAGFLIETHKLILKSVRKHKRSKIARMIFKFILFIYLCLAVLGLRCCARAFSSCGERGLLFVAVRGLLIAVASLILEHGL